MGKTPDMCKKVAYAHIWKCELKYGVAERKKMHHKCVKIVKRDCADNMCKQ